MIQFAGTCSSGMEYVAGSGCTSCQLNYYKDNTLSWETQFEACVHCPNELRTWTEGATTVSSCTLGISQLKMLARCPDITLMMLQLVIYYNQLTNQSFSSHFSMPECVGCIRYPCSKHGANSFSLS